MEIGPCAACEGRWPCADDRIADGVVSTAYLFEDQFFPGWTVLVLKRHAAELFELASTERQALIEDVSRIARTLAFVFSPRKINYELLGNQLPHIHWHVIPRLNSDPEPRAPVWSVPHEPCRLDRPAREARIREIRHALARF